MSKKKKTVFLPSILWENRKLIMNLAKNDYKKKFAASQSEIQLFSQDTYIRSARLFHRSMLPENKTTGSDLPSAR